MSIITRLPCEIINAVLRHVGSLQNLSSALLTCRHVYASFRENPHVAVDILKRQIAPELLPYAVSVMEASRLGPRRARTALVRLDIQTLLNKLSIELHKGRRELQTRTSVSLMTMPLPQLLQMSRTHDVIHDFVTAFSSSAWTHLSLRIPAQNGESVALSSQEYIRFCRAFYRMELYFRLFPRAVLPEEVTGDGDRAAFLRAFPAWENEQIGCVHDFLELEFSKASRDVLAHDVFFGEMNVDYLTPGCMNYTRQNWLGQGVCFVHQLMTETTYDAKQELLGSTFTSDGTDLHETLLELYAEDRHVHDTPLEDYSEKDRKALFEPSEPLHDADRGPFKAWWEANKQVPLHSSIMTNDNAGFRDRAYVLWDEDRLERHGLLELFTENAPESQLELEDTEAEQQAMGESFAARSKIDRKGGRGYWSADDESRIIWRRPVANRNDA